jgi:hypothetical protein
MVEALKAAHDIVPDDEEQAALGRVMLMGAATLGLLASVTTQVRPGIFVGAEARYLRKYDCVTRPAVRGLCWRIGSFVPTVSRTECRNYFKTCRLCVHMTGIC